MVAASLQMSWSLHNEIEDFYCATFDLPTNYFVIWVRIKNRCDHKLNAKGNLIFKYHIAE